jgi:hypothetical protein
MEHIKAQLEEEGFVVLDTFYTEKNITDILHCIQQTAKANASFRQTEQLFAIRRFLIEIPSVIHHLFTPALGKLFDTIGGSGYFVSKSIYFDKPQQSNWFVAYHQDLTLSVTEKTAMPGFGPWTKKDGYFTVQPPLDILTDNFTIRIHLDDTDANNGALRVIPQSHRAGIVRTSAVDLLHSKEVICPVKKGGIMLMKPLLLHASGKTTNDCRRRVIHLEFSKATLPAPLNWSEAFDWR